MKILKQLSAVCAVAFVAACATPRQSGPQSYDAREVVGTVDSAFLAEESGIFEGASCIPIKVLFPKEKEGLTVIFTFPSHEDNDYKRIMGSRNDLFRISSPDGVIAHSHGLTMFFSKERPKFVVVPREK
jgi:hypothetical protein